jgi:hypothetical protein
MAVTRGQRFDNVNFGQRRLPTLNVAATDLSGGFDAKDGSKFDLAQDVLDV